MWGMLVWVWSAFGCTAFLPTFATAASSSFFFLLTVGLLGAIDPPVLAGLFIWWWFMDTRVLLVNMRSLL